MSFGDSRLVGPRQQLSSTKLFTGLDSERSNVGWKFESWIG